MGNGITRSSRRLELVQVIFGQALTGLFAQLELDGATVEVCQKTMPLLQVLR